MTPVIKSLKSNGIYVGIIGSYCGEDVRKLVDIYHNIDYSSLPSLRDVIESGEYEYIMPGCTDLSYMQCARLEVEGCDSEKTASSLHEKVQLKVILQRLGVSTAKKYSTQEFYETGKPTIVKPSDSFSGQGITVLSAGATKTARSSAIGHATELSTTGSFIIEDYIDGKLFSASMYWNGIEIGSSVFVREDCVFNKFKVDFSYVDKKFSSSALSKELKADIQRLANDLSLEVGIIHVQFLVREERYYVLECMRRLPGDLYAELIMLSTSWDYSWAYASSFVNIRNERSVAVSCAGGKTIVRLTVNSYRHERDLVNRLKQSNAVFSRVVNGRAGQHFRSTFFVELMRGQGDIVGLSSLFAGMGFSSP